jgi:hypothetical protein
MAETEEWQRRWLEMTNWFSNGTTPKTSMKRVEKESRCMARHSPANDAAQCVNYLAGKENI